jgi:hypothetical protein
MLHPSPEAPPRRSVSPSSIVQRGAGPGNAEIHERAANRPGSAAPGWDPTPPLRATRHVDARAPPGPLSRAARRMTEHRLADSRCARSHRAMLAMAGARVNRTTRPSDPHWLVRPAPARGTRADWSASVARGRWCSEASMADLLSLITCSSQTGSHASRGMALPALRCTPSPRTPGCPTLGSALAWSGWVPRPRPRHCLAGSQRRPAGLHRTISVRPIRASSSGT